jgi:hypothetical protein
MLKLLYKYIVQFPLNFEIFSNVTTSFIILETSFFLWKYITKKEKEVNINEL